MSADSAAPKTVAPQAYTVCIRFDFADARSLLAKPIEPSLGESFEVAVKRAVVQALARQYGRQP
jgi:hypothetical protein